MYELPVAPPPEDTQTEAAPREAYEALRERVEAIVSEMGGREPRRWFRLAGRRLLELQHDLDAGSQPEEIRQYLRFYLQDMFEILHAIPELAGEITGNETDEEDELRLTNEQIRQTIHRISDTLMIPQKEQGPVPQAEISLDDLLSRPLANGFQVRRVDKSIRPDLPVIDCLEVYSPARDEWFTFPLPTSEQMVHKGGFSRLMLKLIVGAPPSTIEADMPANDFDVVAWGDEGEANRAAAEMGVDLSGIEVTDAAGPEFDKWMGNRDVDLNAAFMGQHELTYSLAAAEAARTGHITPLASFKGLYGSNMMTYDGEQLLASRDEMRAIKTVAEGKALSFSFKELNKQVDIGIYALTLAQKFLKKANNEELLDKTFFLMRQAGQVREDEETVWDTLSRLHRQYPFFDLERAEPNDTEISKWLLGKLARQALRRLRRDAEIPNLMELRREEGDTAEIVISLDGYVPDPEIGSLESIKRIEEFLQECRARNQRFTEEGGREPLFRNIEADPVAQE